MADDVPTCAETKEQRARLAAVLSACDGAELRLVDLIAAYANNAVFAEDRFAVGTPPYYARASGHLFRCVVEHHAKAVCTCVEFGTRNACLIHALSCITTDHRGTYCSDCHRVLSSCQYHNQEDVYPVEPLADRPYARTCGGCQFKFCDACLHTRIDRYGGICRQCQRTMEIQTGPWIKELRKRMRDEGGSGKP